MNANLNKSFFPFLPLQWIPKNERSRGTTIIFTGAMIGTVLTLPITAILSKTHFMGSWAATFYLLGIAGVIWFVLWSVLVFESPEVHPFISTRETRFIIENGGGMKAKGVSCWWLVIQL